MDLGQAAIAEVVRLHEVIEAWICGTCDEATYRAGFADRLHPDMVIVEPSGKTVRAEQILPSIRDLGASNPAFRIRIEAALVVWQSPDIAAVTYVERQEGATRASNPVNARRSTALIERGSPLIWRHLHETWLPAPVD